MRWERDEVASSRAACMGDSMTPPRRILVVEDEPLIAMMLEDFVDAIGHTPAGTADTVASALALIEAGGIDAAIMDVNLRGGEKSWPIADALADRTIPFVLTSGGNGDDIPERHRAAPRLDKPFTMEAIAEGLEALPG